MTINTLAFQKAKTSRDKKKVYNQYSDFSTAIPFQITGQQVQSVVNGISLEGFSITRLQ